MEEFKNKLGFVNLKTNRLPVHYTFRVQVIYLRFRAQTLLQSYQYRNNFECKEFVRKRDFQLYVHLFNKVAYLIEVSLLKRSLLQVTYMIKYKPVLNKEVQKEFPELYTQYIKQTNKNLCC